MKALAKNNSRRQPQQPKPSSPDAPAGYPEVSEGDFRQEAAVTLEDGDRPLSGPWNRAPLPEQRDTKAIDRQVQESIGPERVPGGEEQRRRTLPGHRRMQEILEPEPALKTPILPLKSSNKTFTGNEDFTCSEMGMGKGRGKSNVEQTKRELKKLLSPPGVQYGIVLAEVFGSRGGKGKRRRSGAKF